MPAATASITITYLRITSEKIDLQGSIGNKEIKRSLTKSPKDAWVWDQVSMARAFFADDGAPKQGPITLPWALIPAGIQAILEREPSP